MPKENNTKDRELLTTRVVNAPRTLVYQMFTDPEHMPQWWGPNGFTNTIQEMSVSVGGKCRYIMHGPDGTDYPNLLVYEEVVENEKLVYLHGEDEDSVDANFHVTITFEEMGDKTKINMCMVFATVEEKQRVIEEYGAQEGATQTMNRLEDYIAFNEKESIYTFTRVFDAPIELLYKVHAEQEHVAMYWGPKEGNTVLKEFDFRTGGRMLYCMEGADGSKLYGVQLYREIVAPHTICMINSFSDEDGNAIRHPLSATWPLRMLNRMTFEDIGNNKTKLTMTSVPFEATTEEHQTFIAGHESINGGFSAMLNVLADYLKTLNT